MKVVIKREYGPEQTKGDAAIEQNGFPFFQFKTLELPWKNNQRNISCIPEGAYKAIKHVSPTFGDSIWIKNVPNRSEILVHVGNFVGSDNPRTGRPDLRGCIAPGNAFRDITGDGIVEVVSSKNTLNKILAMLPDEFEVEIK
jgi:hypothetical protein